MTSGDSSVPGPVDQDLADALAAALGVPVQASQDGDGTWCLDVPPAAWEPAGRYLRDQAGLNFLDWLSAVDQPDAEPAGLDVVLHVADSRTPAAEGPDGGPRRRRRVLLRTRVADADGTVASLTGVWAGVAWHERETFEMFGLSFAGFDDGTGLGLRPLLLPEGFEGTPLRKSFVLAARASKAWPGAKEPGEAEGGAPSKRKVTQPPGVPEPDWMREPDEDYTPPVTDATHSEGGMSRA